MLPKPTAKALFPHTFSLTLLGRESESATGLASGTQLKLIHHKGSTAVAVWECFEKSGCHERVQHMCLKKVEKRL